MKNNQLTHAQMYKVCDFVKSNAAHLTGMKMGAAADFVQEFAGFHVTVANIASAREITGVQIGKGRSTSGKVDRAQVIAAALCKLMDDLGHKIPRDLENISKKLPL